MNAKHHDQAAAIMPHDGFLPNQGTAASRAGLLLDADRWPVVFFPRQVEVDPGQALPGCPSPGASIQLTLRMHRPENGNDLIGMDCPGQGRQRCRQHPGTVIASGMIALQCVLTSGLAEVPGHGRL